MRGGNPFSLWSACFGGQSSIHYHWGAIRVGSRQGQDPDAGDEARFVTLGLSNVGNLLVVVYTYREPDIIRIISAWKANRRQRELYEEGRS